LVSVHENPEEVSIVYALDFRTTLVSNQPVRTTAGIFVLLYKPNFFHWIVLDFIGHSGLIFEFDSSLHVFTDVANLSVLAVLFSHDAVDIGFESLSVSRDSHRF